MVAMILANGFEETEAVVPIDVLRRLGFQVKTVAWRNSTRVIGAHNIPIDADTTIDEAGNTDFDAVILPGGMPGAMNLRESDEVKALVKKTFAIGKVVAAICAAPIALAAAEVLNGKRFTAYPGFEKFFAPDAPTGNLTERDGKLVTGKGPGAAYDFALEIARELGCPETKIADLRAGMFWN